MSQHAEDHSPLPQEAMSYYEADREHARLQRSPGLIEVERTLELFARYAPQPPATILDIGGGSGIYAFWLAQQGYIVHLLDAVPLHIERAQQEALQRKGAPLASMVVGDARRLPYPDESAECVLLLGPLYHLVAEQDRQLALCEALRVLKPGGYLFAAAISRFAPFLEGLFLRSDLLTQPALSAIVRQDLLDGQHRNLTSDITYFTTTYFHHPTELQSEITKAGLRYEATFGVEGPLWLARDFLANNQDDETRQRVQALVRQVEQEPSLLGVSSHLLAVARKE